MAKKAGGTKTASKSSTKTGSATTATTGQVGAAETKVTPVSDANTEAAAQTKPAAATADTASTKAGAKEAPAREGHAVGVPRKSMEAKFGPKNPDTAETARRQAAVGGI